MVLVCGGVFLYLVEGAAKFGPNYLVNGIAELGACDANKEQRVYSEVRKTTQRTALGRARQVRGRHEGGARRREVGTEFI